jgi:hypothetical protein
VQKKSREIYDSKKDMKILYNGWKRWITTMGSDIKIELDQRKHSNQLWQRGMKILQIIQRRGRARMMKRAGDLKVGIHQMGDI